MIVGLPVKIANCMNGKCLTAERSLFHKDERGVTVEDYKGLSTQQFMICSAGGQLYTIQNQQGKCLDIAGASKDVHQHVIHYDHNDQDNQKFEIKEISASKYAILSKHSCLVLQIMGGIDGDGVPVVQNIFYKNLNQLWRIENEKDKADEQRKRFGGNRMAKIMKGLDESSSLCTTKFKIVLLGDMGVGKTALIERYVKDDFDTNSNPTVGIDFLSRNIVHDGMTYKLQVWDTAGQERYKSLIPAYMRDANCAILVFDLTRQESLENLQGWLQLFKDCKNKAAFAVLVGSKEDLLETETKRTKCDKNVQKLEKMKTKIEQIAKQEDLLYIQVSAKSGKNITELFSTLIQKMVTPTENDAEVGSDDGKMLDEVMKGMDLKKVRLKISRMSSSPGVYSCCGI